MTKLPQGGPALNGACDLDKKVNMVHRWEKNKLKENLLKTSFAFQGQTWTHQIFRKALADLF